MPLLLAPLVIVFAALMIFAPSVLSLIWRAAAILAFGCLIYVVDGQQERPIFHHGQGKSADVR